MRRRLLLAGVLGALLPLAAQARLPLLRLAAAAAAGDSQDVFAHLVADGLGRRLGVRVLVENRPGAGGLVGFAALARRPADGLHLGVGGDQQAFLPA
jgi:tripartite-type tricarboxylate transporter receptor subunit TctC